MMWFERTRFEWLRRVRAEWGAGPHMSCLAGMEQIVDELLADPGEAPALLHEFGRRCAIDEFPIEHTMEWMRVLLECAPRRVRRALDRMEHSVMVAHGWVAGTAERRRWSQVDVTSMQVMELRLHEQYDRCASLGVHPNEAHALAVFEADVGDLGAMARAALVDVVSTEAHRRFRCGETISATPTGRLVVLTDRVPGLAETVRFVVDAVNASPIGSGSRVRGWVEPLANDRLHLDSHMASLAS